MKYVATLVFVINIIGLSFSFLISPYEFPDDKAINNMDSDAVLVLFLIFGILTAINIVFILSRLFSKKIKIFKWWGDFLVLIFLIFSLVESVRMIWFMKMDMYIKFQGKLRKK